MGRPTIRESLTDRSTPTAPRTAARPRRREDAMTALLPRAARGTGAAPRRRRRDDRRVAWLFIAPVLIGFAVFYLYPTIRGVWWSFTDYSLLGDPTFVGVKNYA